MVSWLPDVQIDILEKWCLGLGAFIQRGLENPQDLAPKQQCQLIDIGLEITVSGLTKTHTEVDRALARHQARLARAWVYGWALQSASPVERKAFKAICQGMSQQQGLFCLYSVRDKDAAGVAISTSIAHIAQATGRSKRWVKRALIADDFLPETGPPCVRDLSNHIYRCRTHIRKLNATKGVQDCAALLGIGMT
ncbi:hypothetical protein KMP13_15135 [Epibacterium ulvae]|uniref:hypothetical protein n=1 Tax=Epibacterium ulvae TaxID=1156985 RepID=UPI001BFCAE59|nr:hypothetical protein [Epibacterium ulvae]MBT8155179.1 hypothetical protein [Epibacterium ulvae]